MPLNAVIELRACASFYRRLDLRLPILGVRCPVAAGSPLCLSLAPRRMLYRSAHRGIHFSSFISAATQVFCAFRRVGVYARVLWDGRLFC